MLDRTAFYPEGGGQESDTGALKDVDVLNVTKQAGVILHEVKDVSEFTPGMEVEGVVDMERQVLAASGIEGIVLRYGLLYGPGTWFEREKRGPSALHVDAAAQAAVLALTKGQRGIYNVAEDDGAVSSEKAKRELGFDAGFRIEAP